MIERDTKTRYKIMVKTIDGRIYCEYNDLDAERAESFLIDVRADTPLAVDVWSEPIN